MSCLGVFAFGLFVLLWFVLFGLVGGLVDGAFMLVYDYCLLQMLVLVCVEFVGCLCFCWWLVYVLWQVCCLFVCGLCGGFVVTCFVCALFVFDMIVFCWWVVWQVVVFL